MTDEGIDRRLDEMVPRWIDRFFVNYEGVHYRITGTQQVEASLKGEKLYLKDTLNELDGTTLLLWQPEKEFFPENVKTLEDGCISIKLKSALLDRYEGGVDRYTLYFLNREKRLAYTVQKEVDRSEMYNNFHRLLGTVDCGEYHDEVNDTYDRKELQYYFARGGELRIALLSAESRYEDFIIGKVKRLRFKNGVLFMESHIKKAEGAPRPCGMYVKLRSKTEEISYDFQTKIIEREDEFILYGKLDVKKLELQQFYWDIRGMVTDGENVWPIRLQTYDKFIRRSMYVTQPMYRFGEFIVYPYQTKSKDFALEYRPQTPQDNWGFILKEILAMILAFLMQPVFARRKVWLVYEKYCIMAQDNGYYFFKYCMDHLPEKEKKRIYYVIDPTSPDYENVAKYTGRVIKFLSLKHMVYLLGAKVLVSSDTKAHAYAWYSPITMYRMKIRSKRNVFLQHGVMAFKCCHQGLKKTGVNGSDLFVVSSDVEHEIIVDNFGYEPEHTIITGLARWDVLEDKSQGEPKSIILMPTWRSWLEEVSQEEFVASDYYKNYMALLNHPKLSEVLEKYDTTLNFYIHPKFREYIGNFSTDSNRIRLIPFGEEPLNEMMMRCNMMITDYSSAVWDVYYQGKPVLFYLFDLEMYETVQGSYFDMEEDSFGDVAHKAEELIELIDEYGAREYKEKEEYAAERKRLIKYIDNDNSKRTYDEIIAWEKTLN